MTKLLSQDEPKGRAAPGLVVKVERGQKNNTQGTHQSPGEEFAVDFSVSEVDFPLWAPEMLDSGGPDCDLSEAPPHSPGHTDASTEPHPGGDRVMYMAMDFLRHALQPTRKVKSEQP